MYNAKLNIYILFLFFTTSMVLQLPAYSGCPSRQLTKVCNACKQGALNSSQCMSSSSTSGTNCDPCLKNETDASIKLFRNRYSITVDVDGTPSAYTLTTTSKTQDGQLIYNIVAVDDPNNFFNKGVGYFEVRSVNFLAPFYIDLGSGKTTLHSLFCSATVQPNGILSGGVCFTLVDLGSNGVIEKAWDFTAQSL